MPCPDEKRRVKIEAGRPSLGKCEAVCGGSAEQGTDGSQGIKAEEGCSSVFNEID